MGTPREPVRLWRGPRGRTAMIARESGDDWTARMEDYARRRVERLAGEGLHGYVLKSRSPSCGMERVKVYEGRRPDAPPSVDGVGLFARALLQRLPNLPVEEEGRLHDPKLRENFIERVFAYGRLQQLWGGRWTVGELVAFHTAHKMQLLAHSPEGYRALGRLVGGAKGMPRAELRARYEDGFMGTLRKLATPGRHANVLMHMLGHLRPRLDDASKQELLEVIEDHRAGLVPLVVPVTLLRHHARRLQAAYLLGQTYLEPHPKELKLRNRP
jgi:uncharacterized protein YbgA (DUF1722 family)